MPDHSGYYAFLTDPDQNARRAELRDFFGPNSAVFLRAYDQLREDTPQVSGRRPRFRLFGAGFEVAALFLGPVWFFYRKMWAIAWMVVALLLVIAFLGRSAGLVSGVFLASVARRTYVQHAVNRLVRLHAAAPVVTPAMVRAEGGVSWPAGILSGTIIGFLTLAGIASMVYQARHGIAPTQ